MISKRIKGLVVLLLALVVLVACGSQEADRQKAGIKVVTTFYPMYDFTKNIVGENGQVTLLIEDQAPHDYEPSTKDIASIEEADVFVYNSEEMETWVMSLLQNIDPKKTKIIAASAGVDLLKGDDDHNHREQAEANQNHHSLDLHLHGVAEHYHSGDEVELEAHGKKNEQVVSYRWSISEEGETSFEVLSETVEVLKFRIEKTTRVAVARLNEEGKVIDEVTPVTLVVDNHDDHSHDDEHDHHHGFDPHVWLDPILAQQEVTTIATGIAEADSDNTEAYQANAAAYNQKLADLHQDFEVGLKKAENKVFVTQHSAFAYLAKRYGLTQLGISGISPELEPTPKELAEAETFIKDHKVTTIFTETLASPKIAKTVADATGVEMAVLSPLESVSKEDREKGVDYISVMEQNLKALKLVIK